MKISRLLRAIAANAWALRIGCSDSALCGLQKKPTPFLRLRRNDPTGFPRFRSRSEGLWYVTAAQLSPIHTAFPDFQRGQRTRNRPGPKQVKPHLPSSYQRIL